MYAIIDLHDRILFSLIFLFVVVLWFLASATLNTNPINLSHGNLIELIWTLTPAAILWAIGLPSFKFLYQIDELQDPELSVKAIGNQWYWSYEFSDYEFNDANLISELSNKPVLTNASELKSLDSFMISEASLEEGDLRQLAVDNDLVLPINTSIRLLVTSNDVIHSFAFFSLKIGCNTRSS